MCVRYASVGKQTSQRAINIFQMNVWIALRFSDNYRAPECISKMPEAQLAGNSVAVTASLPAFRR